MFLGDSILCRKNHILLGELTASSKLTNCTIIIITNTDKNTQCGMQNYDVDIEVHITRLMAIGPF